MFDIYEKTSYNSTNVNDRHICMRCADRKTLWGTEFLPALYRIPPIRYNANRKEIIARITGRRNRVKTYIIIAVRIRTHRRQLRT